MDVRLYGRSVVADECHDSPAKTEVLFDFSGRRQRTILQTIQCHVGEVCCRSLSFDNSQCGHRMGGARILDAGVSVGSRQNGRLGGNSESMLLNVGKREN